MRKNFNEYFIVLALLSLWRVLASMASILHRNTTPLSSRREKNSNLGHSIEIVL